MPCASVLGALAHALLGDRPAFGLVLGGLSMAVGGLCILRLTEPRGRERPRRPPSARNAEAVPPA